MLETLERQIRRNNHGMALCDHAEAWTRKQGLPVPPRSDYHAWNAMYERWVAWAFDFTGEKLRRKRR